MFVETRVNSSDRYALWAMAVPEVPEVPRWRVRLMWKCEDCANTVWLRSFFDVEGALRPTHCLVPASNMRYCENHPDHPSKVMSFQEAEVTQVVGYQTGDAGWEPIRITIPADWEIELERNRRQTTLQDIFADIARQPAGWASMPMHPLIYGVPGHVSTSLASDE